MSADNTDKFTDLAKQQDEYYLCECGVARKDADEMMKHLDDKEHIAERIDAITGDVTAFLAGGLKNGKYGTQIPDSAVIKREKLKNEPMFER